MVYLITFDKTQLKTNRTKVDRTRNLGITSPLKEYQHQIIMIMKTLLGLLKRIQL